VFQIKVEILLPRYYNDKRRIEEEKYVATYDEIIEKFKGCTIDNTPLIGGWIDPDTNERYEDESVVYWIVCKCTKENITFLRQLKESCQGCPHRGCAADHAIHSRYSSSFHDSS
jgi:hypothetical protein